MKLWSQMPKVRRWELGLTLVECLVYIAALGIVLNLATHTFFGCLESSGALRRNADDIVRALRAGERWREDIRHASAPPVLAGAAGRETLRVPQRDGEILYTFEGGKIWRDAGGRPGRQVFLAGVARSAMAVEPRERLTAWRWELELQTRKTDVKVRPLFTFLAVPKPEMKP